MGKLHEQYKQETWTLACVFTLLRCYGWKSKEFLAITLLCCFYYADGIRLCVITLLRMKIQGISHYYAITLLRMKIQGISHYYVYVITLFLLRWRNKTLLNRSLITLLCCFLLHYCAFCCVIALLFSCYIIALLKLGFGKGAATTRAVFLIRLTLFLLNDLHRFCDVLIQILSMSPLILVSLEMEYWL